MTINLPKAFNILHPTAFNINYDIVWSFTYVIQSSAYDSGFPASCGFTTFLIDSDTPTLTGGGIGEGLGYGPSTNYTGFSNISGVSGAMIAVGFDNLGVFGLSGQCYNTGYTTLTSNTITFRSNYNYLSTFSCGFNLISSANTLRFNLTDAGQSIEVYRLINNHFYQIAKCDTFFNVTSTKKCKIGISFASPTSSNAVSAAFMFKDFHVHGNPNTPDFIVAPYVAI